MVKVRGMKQMLFVLGAILEVAEVDVSQGEIGIAVSAKPRLQWVRQKNKNGIRSVRPPVSYKRSPGVKIDESTVRTNVLQTAYSTFHNGTM